MVQIELQGWAEHGLAARNNSEYIFLKHVLANIVTQ